MHLPQQDDTRRDYTINRDFMISQCAQLTCVGAKRRCDFILGPTPGGGEQIELVYRGSSI
jgi:hypothetical protein